MSEELLSMFQDFGANDHHEPRRTEIIKAPFPWVGGKSNSLKFILPEIISRLRGRWIDVFGGSGIVSLNVPRQELMVLNDAYAGVMDFYTVLQSDRWEELRSYLATLMPPLGREQWLLARREWCTETDPVSRAAKWFYMFRNSVIGKGQSFARGTDSAAPLNLAKAIRTFEPLHLMLQHYQLENLDFRTCIKDYDSPRAVFYIDAPYLGTDPGIYDGKWTLKDLRDLLRLVGDCQGTVLFSHYPDHLVEHQVYWANRLEWTSPIHSNVTAFTKENYKSDKHYSKESAKEVLWIKEAQ